MAKDKYHIFSAEHKLLIRRMGDIALEAAEPLEITFDTKSEAIKERHMIYYCRQTLLKQDPKQRNEDVMAAISALPCEVLLRPTDDGRWKLIIRKRNSKALEDALRQHMGGRLPWDAPDGYAGGETT